MKVLDAFLDVPGGRPLDATSGVPPVAERRIAV